MAKTLVRTHPLGLNHIEHMSGRTLSYSTEVFLPGALGTSYVHLLAFMGAKMVGVLAGSCVMVPIVVFCMLVPPIDLHGKNICADPPSW